MIIVITHHVCKAGCVETAITKIDKAGESIVKAPGFLSRYRVTAGDNANTVSTIANWQDIDSYQAFRASRPAPNTDDTDVPFARIEAIIYDVNAEVSV